MNLIQRDLPFLTEIHLRTKNIFRGVHFTSDCNIANGTTIAAFEALLLLYSLL